MGWVNFIVVPDLKLVVETSRNVNELEEWLEKSIDDILNFEDCIEVVEERKLQDVTITDFSTMVRSLNLVSMLSKMYTDSFFLYWLEKSKIEYQVVSEYSFDREKFEKDGFTIWSGE